jgi:hypothetical protein
MTIRYTTNLTFEEQLRHWENGNSEEVKLSAWLRQNNAIPAGEGTDWEEGYDAGYNDARDEFEEEL